MPLLTPRYGHPTAEVCSDRRVQTPIAKWTPFTSPPHVSAKIELGLVVDSTTPNSILRMNFRKCCWHQDLRIAGDSTLLPPFAIHDSLGVASPVSDELPTLGHRPDFGCEEVQP